MSQSSKVVQLAQSMAEKVHGLKTNDLTGFLNQSPAETALTGIRRETARLMVALQQGTPADIERQLSKLEGAFYTAQLLDVVSKDELDDYIVILDEITRLTDVKE